MTHDELIKEALYFAENGPVVPVDDGDGGDG